MAKEDDTGNSNSVPDPNISNTPALDADTVRAIVKDEVSAIPESQAIDEDALVEKIADRVSERFPDFDADGIKSHIEGLFKKHSKNTSAGAVTETKSGGWLSRWLNL